MIGRLSRAIELRARVELSERLAPVPNAPAGVVRQLCEDNEMVLEDINRTVLRVLAAQTMVRTI